ncbi:unnamed protein product [Victoria cruziana]
MTLVDDEECIPVYPAAYRV